MTSAVVCRDVAVELGGHRVLDDVSLEVAEGEWLTVIGPNGAGKSTLLRALAGLTTHAGDITIAGRDSRTLPRREWSRLVALVPQVPLMPTGVTVTEYVLLGRTAHLPPFGGESRHDLDVVRHALERLDLLTFLDRMIDTLSGGERQRVLIARLLAQDAPIALLDEPTSALDVGHQQQVLDLVEELRHTHGLTVIETQHDLTLAGQYGDRVALLVDGRVAQAGPAAEVLTQANVTTHYGARVRVIDTEDGPLVVPIRKERA